MMNDKLTQLEKELIQIQQDWINTLYKIERRELIFKTIKILNELLETIKID